MANNLSILETFLSQGLIPVYRSDRALEKQAAVLVDALKLGRIYQPRSDPGYTSPTNHSPSWCTKLSEMGLLRRAADSKGLALTERGERVAQLLTDLPDYALQPWTTARLTRVQMAMATDPYASHKAADEIQRFLDEHERVAGVDADQIAEISAGDCPVKLTKTDLALLVSSASAAATDLKNLLSQLSAAVAVREAAEKVLINALDAVEVHPCDVDNDVVRSKELNGDMATLYAAMQTDSGMPFQRPETPPILQFKAVKQAIARGLRVAISNDPKLDAAAMMSIAAMKSLSNIEAVEQVDTLDSEQTQQA